MTMNDLEQALRCACYFAGILALFWYCFWADSEIKCTKRMMNEDDERE